MLQKLGLGIAAAVFVSDQITKPVILSVFETGPRVIEVTSFFNLVLVYNRGVSFGLLSNDSPYGPYLLAGLACVIAAAIWHFILRRAEARFTAISAGLIIGGAFGNALDRLLYGAVVDFLDFHVAGYHWPAFNIADCAIVVGAALMVYDSLFLQPKTLK